MAQLVPLFTYIDQQTKDFHAAATALAAQIAPRALPSEKKEVSFERHPLQTLYHLVERATQAGELTGLQTALNAVPRSLRNDLFYEVWDLSTDPHKGGYKWGEKHAFDNHPLLLKAIASLAKKVWGALPQDKQDSVFNTLVRISHPQQVQRDQIDSNAAKLINALHRHQCLRIRGTEFSICSALEKGALTPSHVFDLGRPEIEGRQLRFHNGMYNTLEEAREHASRISDLTGGYNVHCTYSPTTGIPRDVVSAFLSQSGVLNPSVLYLLEEWRDFFDKDDTNNLCQICHSRGAIEVYNALDLLPENLRKRINVVALAPACLIPEGKAFRVRNLVNLLDPIAHVATGKDQISSPHTILSDLHSDTLNPHTPHGASFRDSLKSMVEAYIRTGDITATEG
jgi:hypothetical protein